MGNRIGTHLVAVCLVATALAVWPGVDRVGVDAAEPSARLVRIDMAVQAPLPPLVPISHVPPGPVASAPIALPRVASPPLVSISYAAVPTTLRSLAIEEVPAPAAVPIAPPMPVAIPAPAYEPAPVAAHTAPPIYQSAALPAPLPVALPAPLPSAPVSLPPPLPVYAAPVATSPAALPLPLPVPLPVPAASTALAPPSLPPLPQAAALSPPALPSPALQPPIPQPPIPQPPISQPSVAPQPSSIPSQAMLPPPLPPASATAPSTAPAAAAAGGKPTDAITICSFNIQVFGESKIAKPQVVDVLARVVRKFDIVAVQEVRAKSDSVIPQFLSAINADGSRYQFVIGPRLGRTVSKEQYTFIYDSTRIEVDPSSVGTSPNPGDRLHRPPLHARFRVRANPPESGFTFWLVDTHTDPDEVSAEVNALADVFMEMKSLRPDEDDVILLGDLNAGPPQFGKIKQVPGVGWAVSGVTTNTRRSKTYDNIIFDQRATTEYTGRWGVLDLQDTFGLSIDKALEVSDHNPVWAAFRPWETQHVAGSPPLSGPVR
jgi:deoxyribonuclease-1-like protein